MEQVNAKDGMTDQEQGGRNFLDVHAGLGR